MRPGFKHALLGLFLAGCGQKGTPVTTSPDAKTTVDASTSSGDMLTQHSDNARTGVSAAETCIGPSTVTSLTQLASFHLDGQIYAQPLVYTTGGRRLLVLASTANELAAYDLDTLSPTPIWMLGTETFGAAGTVPGWQGLPLGIMATPVIDPTTNRVYAVARSCPSASALTGCSYNVYAFDVLTGKRLDSVEVEASFMNGGNLQAFYADREWNRAALLLQNGKLFTAYAVAATHQSEWQIDFNGFVISYDASNLHKAPGVYVTTPHAYGGGVWQSGGGLVGDGESVYFATGNGALVTPPTTPMDFPATPLDQENSIVKVEVTDAGLGVAASYFDDRPYHSDGNVFQYSNFYDYDMSSSGVAWIPGTDDLVTGSKGGIVYLLDRSTMKSRQTPLSPFTVASLPAGQTLHIASDDDGPEVVGTPVVWRRTSGVDDAMVYMWPRGDRLTAFHYLHASSTMTAGATSSALSDFNGGMLSFSVNGSDASSAILWAVVALPPTHAAYLQAYDPTTLSVLWQVQVATDGGYPHATRYVPPTISDGRVFVVTWPYQQGSSVLMYGTSACGGT